MHVRTLCSVSEFSGFAGRHGQHSDALKWLIGSLYHFHHTCKEDCRIDRDAPEHPEFRLRFRDKLETRLKEISKILENVNGGKLLGIPNAHRTFLETFHGNYNPERYGGCDIPRNDDQHYQSIGRVIYQTFRE